MKYTKLLTMAAILLGTAGLQAQTTTAHTKPAGFVTHTLKAGQFNLVGLTLHNPVTVSGVLNTVSGTTLTDSDVNFGTALTAGKTYILEIIENANDPTYEGAIQVVTAWSGNTLTTPDDLSAGLDNQTKYQLRAAATISDVFGATNTAGLQGGASATVADNVYVPTAVGFDIYYYSTGGFVGVGWRKVGGGSSDSAETPLVFADGFYVLRRGADANLVTTGSVKTTSSTTTVTKQYTYISGVYPVGSTLASSNLQNSLTGGASATVADQILVQNVAGGFDFYYYSTGGFAGVGWRKVGAGNTDQATVELPSAFIIKRANEVDFNLKITPPTGYQNL